jgi:polyphosphate kinase 2
MGNLKKKDYAELLRPLQIHLGEMQRWVQASGQRVVVVFEGRDTAGKGGAIGAMAEVLNPRGCRVVALPKPSERERTQWYFQRYVEHLPAAGEMVLFDRSWYNRGGVERVMGFCNDAEYRRWLAQTPQFEKMLVDDGILLFKYWFSVDQAQQEERFAERLEDPLKRWKISPIDIAAREKIRRLHCCARRVLQDHAHETRTLVRGRRQRSKARTPEHARAPARPLAGPEDRAGTAEAAAAETQAPRQGQARGESQPGTGTLLIAQWQRASVTRCKPVSSRTNTRVASPANAKAARNSGCAHQPPARRRNSPNGRADSFESAQPMQDCR